MPSSSARKAKPERASKELFENVTNPFCGTLPDDLTVERTDKGLKVLNNGDGKSVAGFERKLPPSSPQVKGKDVELAKAIDAAAKLIGKAKLPMYGGLATDVEGMRAVMALAERSSGIVDHAFSEAQYRNFKIVQTSGWVMSTISEVRNRADLFIIAGSDIHKLHPRFFERVVSPPNSMFHVEAPKRTVVFIGKGLDRSGAKGSRIGEVVTLACPDELAGDVVALLRARLRGFRVKPSKRDGVTLGRDRCARRAVPEREIRRGGLGAARAQLPVRRARRRPIHRPGEGPHANDQICRACGGRRRRGDDGGRRLHLDQRLSAPRQLCDRRPRLRSLPLEHRPDAEGRRGRPSPVDRVDLARACAARDETADHRARHARIEACRASLPYSFPWARRVSITPGASSASIMSCRCRSRTLAEPICRALPKCFRPSKRRFRSGVPTPCSSS